MPEPGQPWYDSVWMTQYLRAKALIERVRPTALREFVEATNVLRTRADFESVALDRVVDDAALAEIKQAVAALRPSDLEIHEARQFGRFVVHDHPLFTALQRELVPLVSRLAGESVEPRYNFLSLYGSHGVCPLHMDAPSAKWTLDVCIAQSGPWPIHISNVHPWPEATDGPWTRPTWDADIKRDPAIRFSPWTLQPGRGLLFSGSSQWHYRDRIPQAPAPAFCDLLFFHFMPAGASDLVNPEQWATRFGIPELLTTAP
jgi:hypothetical protein